MAKGKKTGGRKKGSKNKVPNDIKLLCQEYAPTACRVLIQIMASAATPAAARVAAIKEIFDRGYGKATQPITGEDGGPIEVEFTFVLDNASTANLD